MKPLTKEQQIYLESWASTRAHSKEHYERNAANVINHFVKHGWPKAKGSVVATSTNERQARAKLNLLKLKGKAI